MRPTAVKEAVGFLCTCFGSGQIWMDESGGILKVFPGSLRSLGFRVGFRRTRTLHPDDVSDQPGVSV